MEINNILNNIHLHPMLVHFPIALFVSALIFELLSYITKKDFLHVTAVLVYVLATIMTPMAVYSGLLEAREINLQHPILDIHRTFAIITMFVSFFSLFIICILRSVSRKIYRIVFLLFCFVIVTMIGIVAYNGGRMVYEYGVGVDV